MYVVGYNIRGRARGKISSPGLEFHGFERAGLVQNMSRAKCRCRSLERPAQAPFSPTDHSSKLRGPTRNSPHIASEWGVNLTKLNCNDVEN
ncbi:hypothetical protein AVEN_169389-1 [Araneus ventricosus]|uniref:Uncharacterized protein n=1 Tax=Araneus ventricosus TaxID=182803 RepID=A0A4Y2LVU5_ARAVE|nr:hypothetical protein AVEN_169389-1 [Araneus ventricosus]